MIKNVERREDGVFILTIEKERGKDPHVGVEPGEKFEYEGKTYTIRVSEVWADGNKTYRVEAD